MFKPLLEDGVTLFCARWRTVVVVLSIACGTTSVSANDSHAQTLLAAIAKARVIDLSHTDYRSLYAVLALPVALLAFLALADTIERKVVRVADRDSLTLSRTTGRNFLGMDSLTGCVRFA